MQWFKHNSDARNSLKLRKVRRKYGADGYAIYWFCLEAIAHDVDKDNLTFNLKEDSETIGFELAIQEKRVDEIMRYMIDIGLFESSNNVITCLKLAERLDKSMTNSPKMRKWLGDKGSEQVSKSVMTLSDNVSTCHELEENRIDKIRIEENKVNKKAVNKATPLNYSNWPSVPTADLLTEWLEHRKSKKAKVTQTVINQIGKELIAAQSKGWTVDDALTESITRNWVSVKADWLDNKIQQGLANQGYSAVTQHNLQAAQGFLDEN
jgi:hypothetical protein